MALNRHPVALYRRMYPPTASSSSAFCAVMSPYLRLPGGALPEVRRQPARSASGYLPRVLQPRRRRVDLDSRRVGRRSADRAGAAAGAARALPAAAALPLDHDDDRPADRRASNLQDVDEVFYFPVRLGVHRRRTLRLVQAAALHDDGDRDLAEPAARLPRARRQDGDGQRPDLGPLVSRATGWSGRSSAACSRDVDRFCMQSDESARRIIDLGADPARVAVTGSLKFDSLDVPPAPSRLGRPRPQPRAALLPHQPRTGR